MCTPERVEINTFLSNVLEAIKQVTKNEVKHCDTILVVLQAKYEQLLNKNPTSCTPSEVEIDKFVTNLLDNIKELHTNEVKHWSYRSLCS